MLLTGAYNGTVRFWDVNTGSVRVHPNAHAGGVMAVAFHPDGRTAWTAGGKVVRQWNVETCERMPGEIPTPGTVCVLRFTGDGRSLLTVGKDGVVRRWDAASGEIQQQAMPHAFTVKTAALDADGQILLTGDQFGIARLWNVTKREALGPPLQHGADVTSVAFSPDGHMALTGSLDGTARLWDVATGRSLGPPHVVGAPVRAVAFSPDGRSFATASTDGAARIWRCPQPLEKAVSRTAVAIEIGTGLWMDDGDVIHMLDEFEWRKRVLGGDSAGERAAARRD